MGDYILLAISCILVNNILLAQYLGNCPFLGTSKKWRLRWVWPWPLFLSELWRGSLHGL